MPSGACALTVVADVQRVGFWFTLRAWEAGEDLTSWLVRQGYVTTWAGLEKVIFEDSYQTKTGERVPVICGLIDSGDGERTKEIYRWCAAHPGFLPSKGDSQPTRPWTYKMSNAPLNDYGIQLVMINTAHHKNDLMKRINVAPGDPGCWWLHTNHRNPAAGGGEAGRHAGRLRPPALLRNPGRIRQMAQNTRPGQPLARLRGRPVGGGRHAGHPPHEAGGPGTLAAQGKPEGQGGGPQTLPPGLDEPEVMMTPRVQSMSYARSRGDLLSLWEAARALGVSESRARRWEEEGLLGDRYTIGRSVRVHRYAVEALYDRLWLMNPRSKGEVGIDGD